MHAIKCAYRTYIRTQAWVWNVVGLTREAGEEISQQHISSTRNLEPFVWSRFHYSILKDKNMRHNTHPCDGLYRADFVGTKGGEGGHAQTRRLLSERRRRYHGMFL